MNFTVTYRAKDGALREERVEAANRAECVAECRKRGIAPTGIREGRSGKSAASPSGRDGARPEMKRRDAASPRGGATAKWTVAVAVLIVAVAGGVWWWVGGRGGEPQTTSVQQQGAKPKVEKPKAEKPPKAARTEVRQPVATNAPAATQTKPEQPKREMWMGREIVSTKVVTNGTDLVITRIDTEGKVHKEYTSIHKRLFTNPVDITLSILLTSPENALTPPLPPLGPRARDAFIEALKKPIEISEDDTPEERRIKELVSAAREEMVDELANGRTVNEVIEEHCTFVDEKNKLRAEAMVQYKKLVADGDGDIAEEFRAKANEMLAQKGAKPLKSFAEIQQERVSRREEKK